MNDVLTGQPTSSYSEPWQSWLTIQGIYTWGFTTEHITIKHCAACTTCFFCSICSKKDSQLVYFFLRDANATRIDIYTGTPQNNTPGSHHLKHTHSFFTSNSSLAFLLFQQKKDLSCGAATCSVFWMMVLEWTQVSLTYCWRSHFKLQFGSCLNVLCVGFSDDLYMLCDI